MDLISEVRLFLTPDKKKRKNIYIIDADNCQSNLSELLSSKKTAMVICMSSSEMITKGIYHQLEDKIKAQSRLYIYSVTPGKDSSDIFMASILGWLIGKYNKEFDYYIMSKDKIFESLKTEYSKLGYSIQLMIDN